MWNGSPWLVLVSPCFRENVVATCKIGSFLCGLGNLLQKNVIVLFLEIILISLILFKIWALYCKFFKRILKTDEFLVKLRRPKAPIQNNVWRQSDNRVRLPSIENGNIAHDWPMSNWITLSSHYCQRFIFFGIVFKEILGRKKSKDECSKTIKPISKFLSHIKCTWIKLRIHNTFTKFSKSLHIPFNCYAFRCKSIFQTILMNIVPKDHFSCFSRSMFFKKVKSEWQSLC